jgi:hypothetical protein
MSECRKARTHTTPGIFAQRVCICLIAKDLTFARAARSLQEYRSKGVRVVGKGSRRVPCRANMMEIIMLVYACQAISRPHHQTRSSGFANSRTGTQPRSVPFALYRHRCSARDENKSSLHPNPNARVRHDGAVQLPRRSDTARLRSSHLRYGLSTPRENVFQCRI